MKRVPIDLTDEPGKWLPCAVLAFLAIFIPAFLFAPPDSGARNPPAQVTKVSLVPIPVRLAAPPAPKPEAVPEAVPKKSKPQAPSAAELALKEVQQSLTVLARERTKKNESKPVVEKKPDPPKPDPKPKPKPKPEPEPKPEPKPKPKPKPEKSETPPAAKPEPSPLLVDPKLAAKAEAVRRANDARLAAAKAAADAKESNRLIGVRDDYEGRIFAKIQPVLNRRTPEALLGRADIAVKIRVLLDPNGDLTARSGIENPQVVKSSGDLEFDALALLVVEWSTPLPVPSDEPALLPEFRELNLCLCPAEDSRDCFCD